MNRTEKAKPCNVGVAFVGGWWLVVGGRCLWVGGLVVRGWLFMVPKWSVAASIVFSSNHELLTTNHELLTNQASAGFKLQLKAARSVVNPLCRL